VKAFLHVVGEVSEETFEQCDQSCEMDPVLHDPLKSKACDQNNEETFHYNDSETGKVKPEPVDMESEFVSGGIKMESADISGGMEQLKSEPVDADLECCKTKLEPPDTNMGESDTETLDNDELEQPFKTEPVDPESFYLESDFECNKIKIEPPDMGEMDTVSPDNFSGEMDAIKYEMEEGIKTEPQGHVFDEMEGFQYVKRETEEPVFVSEEIRVKSEPAAENYSENMRPDMPEQRVQPATADHVSSISSPTIAPLSMVQGLVNLNTMGNDNGGIVLLMNTNTQGPITNIHVSIINSKSQFHFSEIRKI
jgi:hypothetical protein